MTAVAGHLRLVDTDTGEVLPNQDPEAVIKALEVALARAQKTIDALRADKVRQRKEYNRRATVEEIWDDWKQQTGKSRSRLTDDRFDAIRALLELKNEPYTLEHFKLVNLALHHYPYVVYGSRRQTGSEESKRVDLAYVCEKGSRFEELVLIGHRITKQMEAAA